MNYQWLLTFWLMMNAQQGIAHSLSSGNLSWWQRWTFPPLVTTSLAVLTILFAIGLSRLDHRNRQRAFCFFTGVAILAIALLSPIDSYSDSLSYMHMVQHMLIMMVAAPLFVLSAFGRILILALPRAIRRIAWRWRRRFIKQETFATIFSHPLLVWIVFGATLWIAHLPRLYEAALHNNLLHDLQHIAFFSASYLFWQVLLNPLKTRRITVGVGVMYLFVASLHTILLGAFMALSPKTWYPSYEQTTKFFDLSAILDQQIAGFIMWMPSCMMYTAIAVVLIYYRLNPPANSLPKEALS